MTTKKTITALFIILLFNSCCTKTIIKTQKEIFFENNPDLAKKYTKLEIKSVENEKEHYKYNKFKVSNLLNRIKEEFSDKKDVVDYINLLKTRYAKLFEYDIQYFEAFSEELSENDILYEFIFSDIDKVEFGHLILNNNGELKERFVEGCHNKWPYEVAKVLDKTIKLYGNCSSYLDSGKVIVEEIYSKKTTKEEITFNTAFVRSKGFRFESQKKIKEDLKPFVNIVWHDYNKVMLFDHFEEFWGKNLIQEKQKFDTSFDNVGYDLNSAFTKIPECLNIEDDNNGGFIHHGHAEIIDDVIDGNNTYKISLSLGKNLSISGCNLFSDKDSLTIWIDKKSNLIIKIQEIEYNTLQDSPECNEAVNALSEIAESVLGDEIVSLLEKLYDSKEFGELIQKKITFLYYPFINIGIDSKKLEFNPPSWKHSANEL